MHGGQQPMQPMQSGPPPMHSGPPPSRDPSKVSGPTTSPSMSKTAGKVGANTAIAIVMFVAVAILGGFGGWWFFLRGR